MLQKKMTVRETFEKMSDFFIPSNVPDGWNKVIQYHVTGTEGGKWYLVIKDKKLTVKEGEAEKSDMLMELDADTHVGIFEGTVSPPRAMKMKKMKIKGPITMGDITIMGRLFGRPKAP